MAKTVDFRKIFTDQAKHFAECFGKSSKHADEADFRNYVQEHVDEMMEKQKRLDEMFAHFDKHGFGCIFSSAKGDRWALILPDASEPGKFRYQQFATFGWVSHYTCDTVDEVLYESFTSGMYVPAPADTLDRLSSTREWAKGIEQLDIITRHNRREIDWATACKLMDQLKEKYASQEAA